MAVFSPGRMCVLLVLGIIGCQVKPAPDAAAPADPDADIRANLARLGPEDQRLAEQQKYCPLMEGVRLGETGKPRKVTVKGVTTFVCCESCVREAREDPDGTVAKIRELEQARAKDLAPPAP